jgi:hypothetical protein
MEEAVHSYEKVRWCCIRGCAAKSQQTICVAVSLDFSEAKHLTDVVLRVMRIETARNVKANQSTYRTSGMNLAAVLNSGRVEVSGVPRVPLGISYVAARAYPPGRSEVYNLHD